MFKTFYKKLFITPENPHKGPFENPKDFFASLQWEIDNKAIFPEFLGNVNVFFSRISYKIGELPHDLKGILDISRRGWKDKDVWGVAQAFSPRFVGLLKYYKEIHHGTPIPFEEDEWNSMIDDMIYYHENLCTDVYDWANFKMTEEMHEKLQIETSYKEVKEAINRYRRGKYYFFKYYESLWD